MPSYSAPINETLFVLNNVLNIDRYNNLPGFEEATPELIEAILGEAAKMCEEIMQPINLSGDREVAHGMRTAL